MTDVTVTQTSPNSITVTDGGTSNVTVNQPPAQTLSLSSPTVQTLTVNTGVRGPAGADGGQGIQGIQGPPGPGLISGGTAGQFPVKVDGTDYNFQWSGNIIANPLNGSFAVSSGASGGISFGNTKLYQSASGVIRTDTNFYVGSALTVGGSQTIGGTLGVAGVNSSNTVSITSGAGGYIARSQSAVTNTVFASRINADTVDRFAIAADGTHSWGTGTGGSDVTLGRTNNSTVGVSGAFSTGGSITAGNTVSSGGNFSITAATGGFTANSSNAVTNTLLTSKLSTDTTNRFNINNGGVITWGPGGTTATDTNLYRLAADTLKTDDNLIVALPGNVAGSVSTVDIPLFLNTQSGTTYTAAATDVGQGRMTVFSSTNTTSYTIPANATVSIPVGGILQGMTSAAGTVTITPDTGVIFIGGAYRSSRAGSMWTAIKTATDTWVINGDLMP